MSKNNKEKQPSYGYLKNYFNYLKLNHFHFYEITMLPWLA